LCGRHPAGQPDSQRAEPPHELTVSNLQDKKRSAYAEDDLAKFEAVLADYRDKSRSLESETVNDLEKHL
jgi:hypothetical protein